METHPVLMSGVAQFQLVHIHPFLDGNGRTSRLLSMLCLYRAGYDFKRLLDPGYRRKGLGKALINECEKVLKMHGLKLSCALIEDSNVASKQLFKSCGYVEHEDIKYFSKRDKEDV